MPNTLPVVRPQPVTLRELRAHLARLPPEIAQDYGRRHFVLAGYIINAFTGPEWVEYHMLANTLGASGATGYFQLDYTNDIARETKSLRMFELAETMFNLQMVEGFHECIDRLKTGDAGQIEATLAELEFAKLLHWHNLRFRFVVPENRSAGDNYDFEIRLDTHPIVCADAKCKLESTNIDATSVRNTLQEGRRKLPRDKPGILYVKIPQHWYDNPAISGELKQVAQNFLRNTERVVLVCYYIFHLSFDAQSQQTLHRHAFQENANASTRFQDRDWHLFKNFVPPDDWVNGQPPGWVKLLNFR
jgi:hypothetical protein